MRCSKARSMINDQLDHRLEPHQDRRLERHLLKCPACREVQADLRSIADETRRLSLSPPSEDLWPAIYEKIAVKPANDAGRLPEARSLSFSGRCPQRLAYGFGALLVLFLSVTLFYFTYPSIRAIRGERAATGPNELDQFKSAGQVYLSAIDALDQATSNLPIDPELAEVFRMNRRIIDDSIEACREAMEKDPGNMIANRHLLISYKKKLELLNDMKTLAMQMG